MKTINENFKNELKAKSIKKTRQTTKTTKQHQLKTAKGLVNKKK